MAPRRDSPVVVLVVGAAVGAVVIGVVGRVAMALVTWVSGGTVRLGADGWVEVVRVGMTAGAISGLLLLVLRRFLPQARILRDLILGGVLFGMSLLLSLLGIGPALRAHPVLALTLATAAAILVLHALILDLAVTRLERPD